MVAFKLSCLAAATLLSLISASPCPFGQLVERGEVSAEEAAKFYKAREEREAGVEELMSEHQKRELDRQEQVYRRQLDLGDLPLGGGLLNGVLQPFSGALALLEGMFLYQALAFSSLTSSSPYPPSSRSRKGS